MSLFRMIAQRSPSIAGSAHAQGKGRNLGRTACALVGALALLGIASTAHAGHDVCLQSSFGEQLVFRNVPPLRPGRTVSLTGIYLNLVSRIISVPFEGTAMMSGDGTTVRIGIFVHEMGAPPLHNFTFEWTADATFAGSGYYDSNADYLADGPVSFTVYPFCKTVGIP